VRVSNRSTRIRQIISNAGTTKPSLIAFLLQLHMTLTLHQHEDLCTIVCYKDQLCHTITVHRRAVMLRTSFMKTPTKTLTIRKKAMQIKATKYSPFWDEWLMIGCELMATAFMAECIVSGQLSPVVSSNMDSIACISVEVSHALTTS